MAGQSFFSYSRDDSAFVLKLAQDLRAAGADVWLDQADIAVGSRWDVSIEQALRAAESVLLVLSPSSVASDNVLDEVSYALEEKKRVVPILLRECPVPFRLRRLQHVDFTTDYEVALSRLLATMGAAPGAVGPSPAPGPHVAAAVPEPAPAPEPEPESAPAAAPERAPEPAATEATLPGRRSHEAPSSSQANLLWAAVGVVFFAVLVLAATSNWWRSPAETESPTTTAGAAPTDAPASIATPAASAVPAGDRAPAPSGNESGPTVGALSSAEVSARLESLKRKVEQNTDYPRWGVAIFGAERARIAAALGNLGVMTLRQSTRITQRKFLLWCSDITEGELQALEQYLSLSQPLTRDRRGSFELADCGGGRNGFEIWVP